MCDDLDICGCQMWVGIDEVLAEYAGEELGRGDWVLFCFYVDGVLHGICGYDNTIVCFGVSGAC